MKATVYYKPTCGTCRKVLDALKAKQLDVQIIEYVKTPPSVSELDAILKKLKLEPQDIVRKKEPLYQEKFAGESFSREEWLKILHENPILIERPIVVLGDRAVVARPPERLSEIFS